MAKEENVNSKTSQRIKAFSKRANISAEEQKNAANIAASLFLKNIPMNGGDIIAFYHAIKGELNCAPLILSCKEKNHKICLPVIVEKNKPMIFRLWQDLENLTTDIAGIKVPQTNEITVIPDIIVMPLVAFDKKGNRLGFGNGYYDKTIASMDKRPLLVGYGFSVQEVNNIEHEDHDIPLDYMISEKDVMSFTIQI